MFLIHQMHPRMLTQCLLSTSIELHPPKPPYTGNNPLSEVAQVAAAAAAAAAADAGSPQAVRSGVSELGKHCANTNVYAVRHQARINLRHCRSSQFLLNYTLLFSKVNPRKQASEGGQATKHTTLKRGHHSHTPAAAVCHAALLPFGYALPYYSASSSSNSPLTLILMHSPTAHARCTLHACQWRRINECSNE